MENKRILYFDILRTAAAIAVITIHVTAQNWYSAKVGSFEWITFDVFNSLVRWAVPAFVMISGALFLGKERGIKYICKNHVLRMITAFAFWSAAYVLVETAYGKAYTFNDGITEFVKGHYHLWYLFVAAGLYLIVPFVREITKSERLTKYFLLFSFIFSIILPTLSAIFACTNEFWQKQVNNLISRTDLNLLKGYVFYFVLGFYLKNKEFSKKQRGVIYFLGLLGAGCTIAFSILTSFKDSKPNNLFLENYMLNNCLESAAVFVLFKYNAGKRNISQCREKFILALSKYSFGVYLCHVMILDFMKKKLEFTTLSLNPLISVPLIVLIVAVTSTLVSALLNHIPGVKKYIV